MKIYQCVLQRPAVCYKSISNAIGDEKILICKEAEEAAACPFAKQIAEVDLKKTTTVKQVVGVN